MKSDDEAAKAFTKQIEAGQTQGLQELKTDDTAAKADGKPAVIPAIDKAANANYGGTIRVGYFRKAASMDGRRGGSFDRIYMHPQNEYLTTLGRKGGHDPAESLAYAYEVLDDGMRIRFHIREGVEFQRGAGTMTASDVAWSLNRVRDPDAGMPGTKFWQTVKNAEAVDDTTVDLHMEQFDALIIGKHLFSYQVFIHSEDYWNEVGADAHLSAPGATGPFTSVKWTPGDGIEYEAHADYWKEGRPYADKLEVKIIAETRTRLAALQTGQLNAGWLQAEMVPAAQDDPNLQVHSRAGVGWDGGAWNNSVAPLDDHRIRQAMIKSIDRKGVNKSIYQNTMGNHNAYMYGPDTSPYGEDLTDVWEGEMKYDPAAAKALVEEYAAEKGLTLPLVITGACEKRPDRQQYCEYMQAVWGEAGLKFEFDILPGASDRGRVMDECSVHITQTGATMNPTGGPGLEGELAGWGNVWAEKDQCLDKHSPDYQQDVQDEIDALFLEAQATTDADIQTAAWKKVQRVALENAWGRFPSMHRVNYIGCHTPTTGGCDEDPFWAHGFWHSQDFWVK